MTSTTDTIEITAELNGQLDNAAEWGCVRDDAPATWRDDVIRWAHEAGRVPAEMHDQWDSWRTVRDGITALGYDNPEARI